MARRTRRTIRWSWLAGVVLIGLVARPGLSDTPPPKPGQDVNAEADKELRKKALELNSVTGSDPTKGKIKALVADAPATKRLLAAAVRMAKEKDQPFNVNATSILSQTAHQLKEYDIALVFYRLEADQAIKMASAQRLSQSFSAMILLLQSQKRYAEAEKVCSEFLELPEGDDTIDSMRGGVLRRFIQILALEEKYDKAMELIEKLIKASPDNWLNMELKGGLLHLAGKLDDSVKAYEETIEKMKAETRIDKKEMEPFINAVRYRLTGVYTDMDQIDKAIDLLKSLHEKEPNNPSYNNDLGFIWADHGMNLEESEKLIRKALEEERKQRKKDKGELTPEEDHDNAAYLDSLGWVLFKQNKPKEAKPFIEEAVKYEEGKHIEIYDHLAEVHLALGEKKEAIEAWKKGLEVAGKSKREQARKADVEKKLKANE